MTVLKPDGAAAFAERSTSLGILAFGADETRAEEIVRSIVKSVAGALDDPFRVSRLDDSVLAGDPGRLGDELLSQSMFGGRRIVWIENAGSGLLKALKALPEAHDGENIFVASAGDLPKTSALRQFCEDADRIGAVICYEDSIEDVRRLIAASVKAGGMAIEDEAFGALVALLDGNRQALRSELAKLLLYCHGNKTIALADVEAICAATGETAVDGLVDSVMSGNLAAADGNFAALIFEGESPSRLVSAVASHAMRLQELAMEMSHGKSADAAVKGARPPIFFKRHSAIAAQLRNWPQERIAQAASSLQATVLSCRQYPVLEEEIASRALLSVARSAKAR